MIDIQIKSIPQKDHEYETLGNYKGHKCRRFIEVSEIGDWRWEFLIGYHELVEQNLQIALGISEEGIVAWDKAHPESDDPGSLPGCPYGDIHKFAEQQEKELCEKSGWSWDEYNQAMDEYIKREM